MGAESVTKWPPARGDEGSWEERMERSRSGRGSICSMIINATSVTPPIPIPQPNRINVEAAAARTAACVLSMNLTSSEIASRSSRK